MLFALQFVCLILAISIRTYETCDIVGASACPHKPEADLKDENFNEYCTKYKDHIECVYKKYKGCDRKEKYVEAMDSMVRGLRKKAKEIIELCEIEVDIPLTTAKPKVDVVGNVAGRNHNLLTSQKVQTTILPCKINTIPHDCQSILPNAQFNTAWNGVLKQKWCTKATSYHSCIKNRLHDCIGVHYTDSLNYYDKILKYIYSQSNINCPGGLDGCIGNPSDIRCKMGVKYTETNRSANLSVLSSVFYFLICLMNVYAFLF
jgi:hypothetical protein